jgi:hypothetical protein
MKIHHIRKNNKLVGTLVAIRDEAQKVVRVGYAVIMDCDQRLGPKKSDGIAIATSRALKHRNNKIPPKIKGEFCEFIKRLPLVKAFEGFDLPKVEDFEFSYEPIHPKHNGGRFLSW